MVTRQGSDSVRLTQGNCPDSVLAHVPQGSRGYFRKALVIYEGKEYVACFALRPDGLVMLVYSDGDAGLIPVSLFTQEPDA